MTIGIFSTTLVGIIVRGNSAPHGPNESSYGEHLQKPDGDHQPVSIVNYGQIQQNSNGYNKETNVWGYQQKQNGLHPEMNKVHSLSLVSSVESESEVQCNGTLEEMDGFCNEGDLKEAMRVLNLLYQQGIEIGLLRYRELMKVIGEVVAKEEAKLIHNHLMKTKFSSETILQNKVLEMYLKCGLVSDAHDLFGKIPARNLTSWDTMIVGLAKNGYGEDAIDVFTEFKEAGGRPDGQIIHGNLETGDLCADIVALLDPSRLNVESKAGLVPVNPSDYVIAEKKKKYVGQKPLGLHSKKGRVPATTFGDAVSVMTNPPHLSSCAFYQSRQMMKKLSG
ncbi:hypothetical protein C5167_011541 [Papaver somniferum]|uniref:Pentatricopeptide repeat-containing protein n=1 Tax=Papaver somniferum TaxID=3469 RepID=A0A4Y7K679_PAPSO|nr:hypothetical protein C5167_011541 [Papaver somniferum]